MPALVLVTTVGSEGQANELARELVARRHAACVNILPGVRSVYRWQGKICRDSEFMLVIKTTADEYDAAAAAIRELHSYDLPEILAFPVERGSDEFLAWIVQSLDKTADFDDDEDVPDVD
ncbi:MAG: divalent-cation tolerance protein CutA [Acidobacteriota bacterium]